MRKCLMIFLIALMLGGLCLAEGRLWDEWYPHDEFGGMQVETVGDYIFMLEYGESGFGHYPPYRTHVHDADENYLFSIDADFIQYWDENAGCTRQGFHDGFAKAKFSDGSYGIVSDTGEILIDGLNYASGFYEGYAYYGRSFGIPLLDKILEKLEIYTGICGRIDAQGNRMEMIGSAMYAPDEEGYMRVLVRASPGGVLEEDDVYIYVDANGEKAFNGAYQYAYPFVDGAAVVVKDGQRQLIDPRGNAIGGLSWNWTSWMYQNAVFEHPMVPVETEEGIRLYNRRGEPSPKLYESVNFTALDGKYLLCDDFENRLNIVDGSGAVVWADWAENWTSDLEGYRIWIQNTTEDPYYYEFDIEKLIYTGEKRLD